jgi:inner membrane protein YidH
MPGTAPRGGLMVVGEPPGVPPPSVRRSDEAMLGGTVASRPAGEQEADREPDYRFSLANERTLLAWIRTALALDAGGLAVIRYAPPLAITGAREGVGIVLVLLGAVTAGASYRRFVRVTRAMRAGRPLPVTSLPRLLAMSMFVLSLVVGALLLVDRLRG